jgi:hypothetical protein
MAMSVWLRRVWWVIIVCETASATFTCYPWDSRRVYSVRWTGDYTVPVYPVTQPSAWITEDVSQGVEVVVRNYIVGVSLVQIDQIFRLPMATPVANVSWSWSGWSCNWTNVACTWCDPYTPPPTLSPTAAPTAAPTPSPTPNVTVPPLQEAQLVTAEEAGVGLGGVFVVALRIRLRAALVRLATGVRGLLVYLSSSSSSSSSLKPSDITSASSISTPVGAVDPDGMSLATAMASLESAHAAAIPMAMAIAM